MSKLAIVVFLVLLEQFSQAFQTHFNTRPQPSETDKLWRIPKLSEEKAAEFVNFINWYDNLKGDLEEVVRFAIMLIDYVKVFKTYLKNYSEKQVDQKHSL